MKEWTLKEEQFIKDNYRVITARAIGEKLGVSKNSIISKAQRLKLNKPVVKRNKEAPVFTTNRQKNCSFAKINIKSKQARDNLMALTNKDCRYTIDGVSYCGERVVHKKPYCEKHYDICYNKPIKKELTEKRFRRSI